MRFLFKQEPFIKTNLKYLHQKAIVRVKHILWTWIDFRLTLVLQRLRNEITFLENILPSLSRNNIIFLLFSLAYEANIREFLSPLGDRKFKKFSKRNPAVCWAWVKASWSLEGLRHSGNMFFRGRLKWCPPLLFSNFTRS